MQSWAGKLCAKTGIEVEMDTGRQLAVFLPKFLSASHSPSPWGGTWAGPTLPDLHSGLWKAKDNMQGKQLPLKDET